jgi:hypothetical protein
VPNETHKTFFSYTRSDATFVLRVASALRAEGRRVWVDQLDIPKGARWDDEVENALKDCSCLLVVLSPASAKSQNVLDEVSYALDEKRTVLPILLQAGSIPFRLKRLQYIDFTGDFDAAYRQLVAALDALPLPETSETAKEPPPVRMVKPPEEMLQRQSASENAESSTMVAAIDAPPAGTQSPDQDLVVQRRRRSAFAAIAFVFLIGVGYALYDKYSKPTPLVTTPTVPAAQCSAPTDPATLDCEQLWLARNQIYACHGYHFSTSKAREHFTNQPWYHASSEDNQAIVNALSNADKAAIDRIKSYESQKHCASG